MTMDAPSEAGKWSRRRGYVLALAMTGVFAVLLSRAGSIAFDHTAKPRVGRTGPSVRRADIVDRNGDLLATSLVAYSLYADPRRIFDASDVIAALTTVLPELNSDLLLRRLSDRSRAFVWIRRELTPRQRRRVFDLGLEGLDFRREYGRVYPGGALAGHTLGRVDRDGHGIEGIELVHDARLKTGGKPLQLTLDARIQFALEDELARMAEKENVLGAAGLVLDASSGAIRAIASWPPLDLHKSGSIPERVRLNRVMGAVYELGSVFKPLTLAAGLDAGVASADDVLDIAEPIRIGGVTIGDIHALGVSSASIQDVIAKSSNIGTVRIAERIGPDRMRAFFAKLGLLRRPEIDFPGAAHPLVPAKWDRLANATASFGHGLAVSPLSLALAYAVIANDGRAVTPHLVSPGAFGEKRDSVILSISDARTVRRMLRAVVTEGTGKRAHAPGYRLAGKTGTAEKPGPGGYRKTSNICSFIAVFPYPDSRYVVMILLDEPRDGGSSGRNAAFNAAPAVGRLVTRIAPLLGIRPENSEKKEHKL